MLACITLHLNSSWSLGITVQDKLDICWIQLVILAVGNSIATKCTLLWDGLYNIAATDSCKKMSSSKLSSRIDDRWVMAWTSPDPDGGLEQVVISSRLLMDLKWLDSSDSRPSPWERDHCKSSSKFLWIGATSPKGRLDILAWIITPVDFIDFSSNESNSIFLVSALTPLWEMFSADDRAEVIIVLKMLLCEGIKVSRLIRSRHIPVGGAKP